MTLRERARKALEDARAEEAARQAEQKAAERKAARAARKRLKEELQEHVAKWADELGIVGYQWGKMAYNPRIR